jgi:hypothetical protein
MADRFVVTVNADTAELTILERQGTDSFTLRASEVEPLVEALRRGSWLAGMNPSHNQDTER